MPEDVPRALGEKAMTEHRVVAVERALSILGAFEDGARQLSLAELARRTGLYRSTILRLADSLGRFGYIQRGPDGTFSLGPTLLRLGVLYQNGFDLAEHVRPVLRELVELTGESATFYIRQGDKRICLYRHQSKERIRHYVDEGTEMPLDSGSGSHVLMAYTGGAGALYDEIRSKGYWVAMGELDAETGGVSAPVFGNGGVFLGALGVAGLRHHFDEATTARITDLLLDKAARLSHLLGDRRRA